MLKNKLWIVALLAALTMAFFGCTDAARNDDGTQPKPLDDLEIDGKDLKIGAVGNNASAVSIEKNVVTFTAATTSSGFAIDFPPESDGYIDFDVFFKIVAITAKRPGLLVKNSDLSNFVGIVSDQDMHYQILDNDLDGVTGQHFTRGHEFSTAATNFTLRKDAFKGGKVAFFHQQYQPSGNDGASWAVEVVKIVFYGGKPGGGGEGEGGEETPAYTGNPSIKQKVLYVQGEEEEDDVIIDFDPFVTGEGRKKIDDDEDSPTYGEVIEEAKVTINKTTGVVHFDNTMSADGGGKVSYKFPTAAYTAVKKPSTTGNTVADYTVKTVGKQSRIADPEEYDIEADFDIVKIEYEVTNNALPNSTTAFKTKAVKYDAAWWVSGDTNAYKAAGAAQYDEYKQFDNGTGFIEVQTWGAGGTGGITFHYNIGDNGKGTVDFKITKVTFSKSDRVTVKFLSPQTNQIVDSVTIKKGNALTKLPSLENKPWTFLGWYGNWVESDGNFVTTLPVTGHGSQVTTSTTFNADTTVYAVWTLLSLPDITYTLLDAGLTATDTLFVPVDTYNGVGDKADYDGKKWWVVANSGFDFDSFTPTATVTADLLAEAKAAHGTGSASRLGINLSKITPNISLYSAVKVTVEYLDIGEDPAASNNEVRSIIVRSGVNSSGAQLGSPWINDLPAAGYPGSGLTVTTTGGSDGDGKYISFTKNNSGAFLMRVTKIELIF